MDNVLELLPPDPGSYGLSFSCNGLMNKDTFSKSDPCVIIRQKIRGVFVEIGRTETIEDDLNPVFKKQTFVDYQPEQNVLMQFAVYDADDDTEVLKNKDLIGSCDVVLQEIINAAGMTKHCALRGIKGDENESKYGGLTISAAEAEPPLLFREGCTAELHIECERLKNLDLLSKSDPMCVVRQRHDGMFKEVGRTEQIMDNLSPKFETTVAIEYTEEKPVELQFTLYDIDNPKREDLSKQDFLGTIVIFLLEITSGRASETTRALKGKDGTASERKYGLISIKAIPVGVDETTPKAVLTIECQGLAIKDVFEKAQPFCVVQNRSKHGHWRECGRTEVLEDTLDPKFNERISQQYFADAVQDLKFSLFSADHYIGSFELTLGDLVQSRRSKITDYLTGKDGIKSSSHGMIIISAEVSYPHLSKDVAVEEEVDEEEEEVDESTLTDSQKIARMQLKLGKVKGRTERFETDATDLTKLLARGNVCTFRQEAAPQLTNG